MQLRAPQETRLTVEMFSVFYNLWRGRMAATGWVGRAQTQADTRMTDRTEK